MSMKLKVLGLGLLAVLATSAFAVVNAPAKTSGHFTHDVPGGTGFITGTEGGTHRLKFDTGGTPIECDVAVYHGTAPATATTVDVTPTWEKCHTEGAAAGTVIVHHNECQIRFHSNTAASTSPPTEHATTGLVCPAGKAVVVTHENCTMTMPPQALKGVTYTTLFENGRHTITLDSTVEGITTHYHGGICIFLGTTHVGRMQGSVTVEALNSIGERFNLTAT